MQSNKKLKHCRIKMGLTQREVSKAFNIVPAYLSMIERGVRSPGFKLAKKLADFYGYIVDELYLPTIRTKSSKKGRKGDRKGAAQYRAAWSEAPGGDIPDDD